MKKLLFLAIAICFFSFYLSLVPADPTPGYYGNEFLMTNVMPSPSIDSGKAFAMRFTAQNSKIVSSVSFFVWGSYNSGAIYRVGLKDCSGANGFPSGAWLTQKDVFVNSSAWNYVIMPDPKININAGQCYHVVVEFVSSGTGGYIAIKEASTNNHMTPLYQTLDLNQRTSYFDGTWTAFEQYQPMYMLCFTDGTCEGVPFFPFVNSQIYGTSNGGEQFTLSPFWSSMNVRSVGFYIRSFGSPGDLNVVLYNITDNKQEFDVPLASAVDANNLYYWKDTVLPYVVSLDASKTYRVYLKCPSPACDVSNYWAFNRLGISPITDSNLLGITFDGIKSIYTFFDGVNWINRLYYEAPFRFQQFQNLQVTIDSPPDGSVFTEGATIDFRSTVTPAYYPLTFSWDSNKDGQISSLEDFQYNSLSAGDHNITLRAIDSIGETGINSIVVKIKALANDIFEIKNFYVAPPKDYNTSSKFTVTANITNLTLDARPNQEIKLLIRDTTSNQIVLNKTVTHSFAGSESFSYDSGLIDLAVEAPGLQQKLYQLELSVTPPSDEQNTTNNYAFKDLSLVPVRPVNAPEINYYFVPLIVIVFLAIFYFRK